MSQFGAASTSEEVANAFASEINGTTVLITGVTPNSLGAEFALSISKHEPKLLILAGRNLANAGETQARIQTASPTVSTKLLELDLGSQRQIRKAAEEVNGWGEPIDRLVNSAGIAFVPFVLTEDGLESHFGTNHIGPFLFTNLIMPRILAAGKGARVVNISAGVHYNQSIRFDDPNYKNVGEYHKWAAYAQSKTANILFTISLAEKLRSKGLLSFSLHPGVIWTNLGRLLSPEERKAIGAPLDSAKTASKAGPRWKTIPQGAATYVAAAFDPSIESENGGYLQDCQVDMNAVAAHAKDKIQAANLWAISEEIVGQKFEY